jgi:hypothetical protein
VLVWMYTERPKPTAVRYNRQSKYERNAEIARRRLNGESLPALAREFGLTVLRVWSIVARWRCVIHTDCFTIQ